MPRLRVGPRATLLQLWMLLGLATLPPVAQPVQFQRRPALTGPLACKTAPLILNTVLDQSAPLVPTGTTTASSPDTTIHCQVPVERSSARNWLARIGLPGVGRSSIASALTGPDLHLGTSQTLGRAPALDPAQSSDVVKGPWTDGTGTAQLPSH